MATNLCSRNRTKYVSPKEFAEYFSLTKSQAYRLVNEKNFPKIRCGEKTIRIPLEEAVKYIDKKYN